MPVEVACPKCGALLRAPDGMGGKKVRCKKCETSFRLPGPVPADSVSDSVALSVIDGQIPTPSPAGANPFAFDSAPALALPAAAPAADPFALPNPTDPTPTPDKSKSKYRGKEPSKVKEPVKAKVPSAKRSKLPLILGGLFGLLCAAGGAVAVFFLMPKPTAQPVAQTAPPTSKPAEADAPPPTAPAYQKKQAVGEPKAAERAQGKRTPTVMVSDGLSLPPTASEPGMVVQKPETTFSIPVEPTKIRRVLLAKSEARIVAVVYLSVPAFQGKGAKDAVERYATTTGAKVDRIEIDADGLTWPRPCDLSPDGHLFAAEGPPGKVSVWDVGLNQKMLDGVAAPGEEGGPAGGVAGVYFVDEEKIAVVSKVGAVDVWQVRNKSKAVTGKPLAAWTAADILADRRNVTIAPDRRAILIVAGGAVHRITTDKGEATSVFTLPSKGGIGYALAADVTGEKVVVVYQATEPAPHTLLVVATLGAEQPVMSQPLAAEVGTPGRADWVDQDNAVIVMDADTVGLVANREINRVFAAIRLSGKPALLLPGTASGQLAYLLPDPKDAKKSLFAVLPFPPDGYQALRDAGKDKPLALTVGPDGLRR